MTAAHASCDTALAEGPASARQARHPNWVLAATVLASSLAFVDGSVVNVGLPAVRATFHAAASDLQWVVNAYLLPLSALLLLGGAAGDRFGRVRMLVAGTGLFGAASLACALAPSLFWLLGGRAVQGIGSALLMPNSLAILGATFSGEARGKAIGIWASMGAVMGALGPVLGGWLIDTVGWRAIFLINLPLAAGAIVLAIAFVDELRREKDAPSLDLAGGLLATMALGLITWGLTIASGDGGWTITALLAVSAGLAAMLMFLFIEKVRGDAAMMPLALFGSSDFVGLTALTLLLYGALGALMVLVPYTLIQAAGYTAAGAGAALLPFAMILALASPQMGSLAGRIGARVPLTLGPLAVAAGFLLLLRVDARADYWRSVLPALLVIAIGMAGAVAPLTTAVLGSVDRAHTGSASGLNSAVARTGGMIATAMLGGILGTTGPGLIAGFHVSAMACALACAGASASAFFLIRNASSYCDARPETNVTMTAAGKSQSGISRGSTSIAALSTIVEWYDFTLYLYFATVLSRVFFGPGEAALITTLAGFAVAYLLRPFGAIVFGHIGDKFGRRRMMLLSIALMTMTMLGTALLPTYAQIGSAASWLLFLLRCVMGFSVGGEYSSVVAYLLEGAPPNRRGLVTSFASAASEIGGLLAVGVSSLTVSGMSAANLDVWGWRIPFLVGAALAASVWIARSTIQESPEFERQQASGTVPINPLRHTLTHHRAGILRSFAISALGSITYYVGITYVPTFLTTSGAMQEGESLWLSTVAALVVILVTPLTGALSDRLGRRPVLVFLCVCSAILPIVFFHLMADGSHLNALLGAVLLACVAGGVSAVGAVATAEQFPGEGRLTGLALGATMATAIFGGLTPYAAQVLTARTGSPIVPGAMIAIVALCVLPLLIKLPETKPRHCVPTKGDKGP